MWPFWTLGSQVTSISESFYQQHLSDHEIHPVEPLLRVVGAAGQAVPFLSYVDVEFPENEAGLSGCVQALGLVVPDNAYHQGVPLVVGTNIVKECKDRSEERDGVGFLQRTQTSAWRQAYKSMCLREHLVGGKQKVLTKGGRALTMGTHK